MKIFSSLVVLAFVAAPLFAQDKKETKIDVNKLYGTWELVKGPEGAPMGATAEMKKDGTMLIKVKIGDMEIKIDGKFEVKGDKLTVILTGPGGEQEKETDTIKELTDSKMVTEDSKGKTTEFKKVK
ncbi:MAG: hypothetical protein R3B84_18995 [Zavarzinella sp.]